MEQVYYSLLGFLFINFVYLVSKFLIAIKLGIHDDQLFLGYGKHKAFKIKVNKLTIYFGLFIPLPWLAKFYSYNGGVKGRITYEWEFFDRSLGIRFLVIFGGTIGSLLVSMLIFSILSYHEKEQYISKDELNKYGIYPSEYATAAGFLKGDRILKINGEDYDRFQDLLSPSTLLNDLTEYEVLRGSDTIVLQTDWDFDVLSENTSFIFVPNASQLIMGLAYGMPAEASGMQQGDVITMIDSIEVRTIQEISSVLNLYAGDTVSIQLKRGDELVYVTPAVTENGSIGIYPSPLIDYSFDQKSIGEAIVDGIRKPFYIIKLNIQGFAQMLGAEVTPKKKVGGPIRIAAIFGDQGTSQFFRVSAILLALIPIWDLFPFPKSAALKGVPLISELFLRRRMSYDLFVKIKRVGWFIIGALMVGVLIGDIGGLV